MILPAKLFEEKLKLGYEAALREDFERYRWFRVGSASAWQLTAGSDDWGSIDRVSLTADHSVLLGYFSASVHRDLNIVDGVAAVSFVKGRLGMAYLRDLSVFIDSLCAQFHFIRYSVTIGNPAAATWQRAALKRGGKIIGETRRSVRLADGTFGDSRLFEIPGQPTLSTVRIPQ